MSSYKTTPAVGFAHGSITVPSLNEIVRAQFAWGDEPSEAMVVADSHGARIYVRDLAHTRSWASVEELVRYQIRHLESGAGLYEEQERADLIARFKAWCAAHGVSVESDGTLRRPAPPEGETRRREAAGE